MSTLTFASTVPCFSVADVSATMRWYEHQLGFHGDPFPQTEPYQFATSVAMGSRSCCKGIDGYEKPDLYERGRGGAGAWGRGGVGAWERLHSHDRREGALRIGSRAGDCDWAFV